jgi:hypothetical protein
MSHTASRLIPAVMIAAIVTASPRPAAAHHSFAMYDQSRELTFTGRLIRFVPGGNHAQLIFEVLGEDGRPLFDPDGEVVIWGVETGPAASIADQGITVKSFPLGTVLTVTLNPLRDGRPFGSLARDSIIIKCGSERPPGGCNEQTGKSFLGSRN